MPTYPTHPAAELLPPMPAGELEALAEDIRRHDLREPITLLNGKVLDGRHRLRACEMVGVEPRYHELTVADVPDPTAYVLSANLHRRHLNRSQRAMIAAKVLQQRERRRANLPAEPGRARDTVASALNVSSRTVAHARTVREKGSAELIRAVEMGGLAVSRAARIAESTPQREQWDEMYRHVNRGSLRSAILAALADREVHDVSQIILLVRTTIANADEEQVRRGLERLANQTYRGQTVRFQGPRRGRVQLVPADPEQPQTGAELFQRMVTLLAELDVIARHARTAATIVCSHSAGSCVAWWRRRSALQLLRP